MSTPHRNKNQRKDTRSANKPSPMPDHFANASHQNSPKEIEVPKPSVQMMANAKYYQDSWFPKTLPEMTHETKLRIEAEVNKEEESGLDKLLQGLGVSNSVV